MIEHILFHQFKHHLNFLKDWVVANMGNTGNQAILTIKTIGASQLDLYCGNLSVIEILLQAASFLQMAGITNTTQAMQWAGNGYKLCTLSDGSSFTIQYINHSKPVHIHPSRHAAHTMRIKANTLKSAIIYMLAGGDTNDININIKTLNTLRQQHLSLSPVNEKQGIDEITKAIKLLTTPPA